MNTHRNKTGLAISGGLVSGIAGACVLMAARSFDQKYAPKTVPDNNPDPGRFLPDISEPASKTPWLSPEHTEQAAVAAHLGCGSLVGLTYGLCRGSAFETSVLADGIMAGMLNYVLGSVAVRPTLGLTQPVWKQDFPQIAGDLLRHTIFGVATTAAFKLFSTVT